MGLMSRTTISLHWTLGFPRTVSTDAEIFKCARAGLIRDVKRLFSLGKASAKDVTMFGTSLLHSASRLGNMELVCLLIQEGADVNAQDEDGESPLHRAMARSDNYDIARVLIENGADLSNKAVDARTPFHTIFSNTIGHVLMRDDWLETMLPDSEAMSITHYLAWSSRSTPEIFQRGHSYDEADLFSADKYGKTCLHLAASRGNLRVLTYLVEQVSLETLEKKDTHGRTPLHYAAGSSRAAGVIDILIGKGCDTYAIDATGRTALHWAAQRNNFEAVKKLIAITSEGSLLLSDANARIPSQEVCQKRAPALYDYLRKLESSKGLSIAHPNNASVQHDRASRGADLAMSLLIGLLALSFVVFLKDG